MAPPNINIINVIPIPNYNINSNNFTITEPIYDNIFNYYHTGNYSITSSSYYNNFQAFNAFNKSSNVNIPWVCNFKSDNTNYSQDPYYNADDPTVNCSYQGGGNNNNNGNYWKTNINDGKNAGSEIAGEWIQIQIPTIRNTINTIYLFNYSILTPKPSDGIFTFPTKFMLVGSNDGTIWDYIDQQNLSIIDTTNQKPQVFNINSINSYSYFRLIILELPPQRGYVSISNWSLNFVPNMRFNIDAFTTMNANSHTYDYYNFSRYSLSKQLENENENEDKDKENINIEQQVLFDNNYQQQNIITPFLIFILAISVIFYYKKNY